MRILIVEDDKVIAKNLQNMLLRASYAADIAYTMKEGYNKCIDEPYDLLILDWMLPDGSGVLLCKKLRDEKLQLPILMLTARTQSEDTIQGLNSGADDYLKKPFVMDELYARVRALMRRKNSALLKSIITIKDLEIDLNTYSVKRGMKQILLSPKEFALLRFLSSYLNQAVDRLTILSHVWDEQADLFSNTVDVHIRYIRKKIDDGHTFKLIRTIKGKGYMICDR